MAKKARAIAQIPLTADDTQVELGAGDPENEGLAAPSETTAGPRLKRYQVLVVGATAICGGGHVYPVQPAEDGGLRVALPAGEAWYAAMVESGQLVLEP